MTIQEILQIVDTNMQELDRRLGALSAAHNKLTHEFIKLRSEFDRTSVSTSTSVTESVTVKDVQDAIFEGGGKDTKEALFNGYSDEG